jgi:hypothetical protein
MIRKILTLILPLGSLFQPLVSTVFLVAYLSPVVDHAALPGRSNTGPQKLVLHLAPALDGEAEPVGCILIREGPARSVKKVAAAR